MICSVEELRPRITTLLRLEIKQYTFPRDFFDRISYFFFPQSRVKTDELQIHPLIIGHLDEIKDSFSRISSDHWNALCLAQAIEQLTEILSQRKDVDSAATNGLKRTPKAHLQSFLRWAVSYGHPGPTIAQTMEILGRGVTLERLEDAAASLMMNQTNEVSTF